MSAEILKEIRARGFGGLLEETALRGHVTAEEIVGRTRPAHVVAARRMFFAHLRDAGWSDVAIGKLMRRDHTTVRALLRGVPRPGAAEAPAA